MSKPTRPQPPPVYRPQPTPKVLQRKTVLGGQPPLAPSRPQPVAPPVYRPQPVVKGLQMKTASAAARPHPSQSGRAPVAPPSPHAQRPQPARPEIKAVAQARQLQHRPPAAPAHRPLLPAKSVQPKLSAGAQARRPPHAGKASVIQCMRSLTWDTSDYPIHTDYKNVHISILEDSEINNPSNVDYLAKQHERLHLTFRELDSSAGKCVHWFYNSNTQTWREHKKNSTCPDPTAGDLTAFKQKAIQELQGGSSRVVFKTAKAKKTATPKAVPTISKPTVVYYEYGTKPPVYPKGVKVLEMDKPTMMAPGHYPAAEIAEGAVKVAVKKKKKARVVRID